MIRAFDPEASAAGFEPYRAEEVAVWRAQPYLEVKRVREELLRRIASR